MKPYVSLCVLFLAVSAANAEDINIRIEAAPDDAVRLLDSLNNNGRDYRLRYVASTENYHFRVAVVSESAGADILIGQGADGTAVVLSPDCKLLFAVTRTDRFTRGGVINAITKELNKKFAAYLKVNPLPTQ